MRSLRFFITIILCLSGASGVAAQSSEAIWQGIFSDAQAERGAEAYSARCASCHAVDLRGNSNSPSLLGMSFMFLWEGRSVGELYTKMRTGMPSDQPGSLPAQTYLDILSFILRANQYPAGDNELMAGDASLDGKLDGVLISAAINQ